jgi:hypothetical protein
MKHFLLPKLTLIIATIALTDVSFAATPTFVKENSFSFIKNPSLIETNRIQMFTNYYSLEQVKKSELLKKIDTHNILQQYYGDIGEVLVAKEMFLISTPQTELEKNIYKQPSMQTILFPSVNFYDCNSTSCKAKQYLMGTEINFTAFYTYDKNISDNSYTINQFGTNWSMAVNNAFSFSVVSKYNTTTSLITSYQVFILKGGTSFFQNKVTAEVKKQILDFHSCFQTHRCQKNSGLFF